MKHIVKSLVLFLFLLQLVQAHSQGRLGIYAGKNFTRFEAHPEQIGPFDSGSGFTGGLVLDAPISNSTGLIFTAGYSRKGAYSQGDDMEFKIATGDVTGAIKLKAGNDRFQAYVKGGVYAGPVLWARGNTPYASGDLKEYFKEGDWGVIAGGGLQFNRVFFEVNYLKSLESFAKDNLGFELYNVGLSVTAGIYFL